MQPAHTAQMIHGLLSLAGTHRETQAQASAGRPRGANSVLRMQHSDPRTGNNDTHQAGILPSILLRALRHDPLRGLAHHLQHKATGRQRSGLDFIKPAMIKGIRSKDAI